jgi:hypothetical protein
MPKNAIVTAALALAYGMALALVLEPHLVPGLVETIYRGEAWGPLNRVLSGRSQYPLDHYLTKWHARAHILAIALLGAAALTLAGRWAWGRCREVALLAVFAPALACGAACCPTFGDYQYHSASWRHVLAGDPIAFDPEWGMRTGGYGPLFNLLAVLAAWDPLAPKVLYALAWAALLACLATRHRGITLALAPLGILHAVVLAYFDILVALCLLGAMRGRRAGRDPAAGAWLGAGFLLKFLPIALLPFLALDGRRLRWRLVLATLAISVGGLALSAAIWGPVTVTYPLSHAGGRLSVWISPFAFARVVLGLNLDAWSTPAIAVSLAALMAWAVSRRSEPVLTALAALGVVLMLYKVGAKQYPTMLAVPAAWFAARDEDRWLRWATMLYAGWVSAFNLVILVFYARWPARISELARRALFRDGNPPGSQGYWGETLVAAAVPACLITLVLIAALLRRARAQALLDTGPRARCA